MTIVGRGEWYAGLLGQRDHSGDHGVYFLFEPVVLHFEVIITLAENVFELFGLAGGFFEFFREQERRRNAGEARRQRNQPFAMRRQQFFVDARLVVVALCERERR